LRISLCSWGAIPWIDNARGYAVFIALEATGHGPVADQSGLRAQLEHRLEVADVVVVVVGDENPADVLGLDDGEDLRQPVLAHQRAAGVDDHGLGAADHEAVAGEGAGAARVGSQRGDEERVTGDGIGGGGQELGNHGFVLFICIQLEWIE